MNSINLFPRTPNDAGLIAVQFKKQKEKPNTYIEPRLTKPNLVIKWLKELKRRGNPHYLDVNIDSLDSYEERCHRDDLEGWKEIFPQEWQQVQDEFCPEDQDENINDEEGEDAEESGDDQKSKDENPIKKHQYNYDKSFFMADMHPEMDSRTIHDRIITVAPGEDQKPVDVCYDPGWDVKAYPHLSNMDGSNGLAQARQVTSPFSNLIFVLPCLFRSSCPPRTTTSTG